MSPEPKKTRATIHFPPSPHVGAGLNGLGYGAVIIPSRLSFEWIKTRESVAALPVSAAIKERIVNTPRGVPYTWNSLKGGWYLGEWRNSNAREADNSDYDPLRNQEGPELSRHQRGGGEEEDEGEGMDEGGEVHGVEVEVLGERLNEDTSMAVQAALYEDAAAALPTVADGGATDEEKRQPNGGSAEQQSHQEQSPSLPKAVKPRARAPRRRWDKPAKKASRILGFGYFLGEDGVQNVGHFHEGSLHDAHGIVIDSHGVYHGAVIHGVETGRGTFYWRNTGDVATGLWVAGQLKYGSILYSDGHSIYTGAFRNNQAHGLGVGDYFHPTSTPACWEQYTGEYRASNWWGPGRLICTDRTIIAGTWAGEYVEEGSTGAVDAVNAEHQFAAYVGEMQRLEAKGHGRMRWTTLSNAQKHARQREEKERKEAGAKRKREHLDRVAGNWSTLAAVRDQQRTLAAGQKALLAELAARVAQELRVQDGDAGSSVYEGQFLGTAMHGQGRRVWANGDVYDGAWLHGICNGYGRWKSRDRGDHLGDVLYDGGWKNDMEHGVGTLINSMPQLGRMLFHGRFREGWLTGMGSVYFMASKRLYYVGRMLRGAFDGEGVMQLEDGSLYLGGFAAGEFTGAGRWVDAWKGTVYTGRFKDDCKKGCARIVVHEKTTDHAQQSEQSDSPSLGAAAAPSSAPVEANPQLALAQCEHSIRLPLSFGRATHAYFIISASDAPVFRVLDHQLDALLDDIGYIADQEDGDSEGLVREEQLDTAREEKKRAKSKQAEKKQAALAAATAAEGDGEKERDAEALAEVGPGADGVHLLEHYQRELQRLSLSARSRKRGRKEEPAVPTPSLASASSVHLEQSLRAPPSSLALFEPAPSSLLRRIRLSKAMRLCVRAGVCTFAVTGHIPADFHMRVCATCSTDERRVEVCKACEEAGCHTGHRLDSSDAQRDPDSYEAWTDHALHYCACGLRAGQCHTTLDDWRDDIDRAAQPTQSIAMEPAPRETDDDTAVRGSWIIPVDEAAAADPAGEAAEQHEEAEEQHELLPPPSSLPTMSSDTTSLLKPSEVRAAAAMRSAQKAARSEPSLWPSTSTRSTGEGETGAGQPHPQRKEPTAQTVESSPLPDSSLRPCPSDQSSATSAAEAAESSSSSSWSFHPPSSRGRAPSSLFSAPKRQQTSWVKVDGKWTEQRTAA